MAKTIWITQTLKDFVEGYLKRTDPLKEHGGFFLGKNNELIIPRIFPNYSNSPRDSYLTPKYWKELVDLDLIYFNLDYYVHFHTHPDHTFYSKQDLKVAHERSFSEEHIVLLFDREKETYTWRAYNSRYEEQYVEIVDKSFDKFKIYFTEKLNLIRLGDLFLTDNGDLLSTDAMSELFVHIDKDTFKIFKYLKQLKKQNSYKKPSFSLISERCNIPVERVKKALRKIKKAGYYNNLIKL